MKYIGYWSFEMENIDKLAKKNAEMIKLLEKSPKMYPRVTYGPYSFVGEPGGFVVVDVEAPEQLVRWVLHYEELAEWSFVPIYSTMKATQIHLQTKK